MIPGNQCEAVVVAETGNEVWVEVPGRAPSCGNCATTESCQTGLLGLSAGPRRYRLENRIGARVGDHVQLAVEEGAVWQASLMSYVLPLLLAIGGAVIGQTVAGGDAAAVLGTLLGLGGGLVLLRRNEMRARSAGIFALQVRTEEIRFKEKS